MPVPVANFGHEIDLILQHKILAEQGCSFLVVEAASDDWADRIAGWVRKGKASIRPTLRPRHDQVPNRVTRWTHAQRGELKSLALASNANQAQVTETHQAICAKHFVQPGYQKFPRLYAYSGNVNSNV